MAFRKRTNAYWEKRAQEQLALIEQQSLPYLREIDKAYLTARRKNLEGLKKLYATYYAKDGFDTQAIMQLAPNGDIRRFKEEVARLGLSTRLPDGWGFRVSRLELLDAQMWLEVHKAGLTQLSLQTTAHQLAIETAYYHSLYTLSKGTGIVPVFSQLDTRTVNQILTSKFYGKNYSDRVWANTGKLASELKNTLASSVASGQSYTKTAKEIKERYGVSRYQATRLVQTETARFNTLGTDESYRDVGIEEWVYIATLDSSTSDTCADYDNDRFPMNGGPSIPIHPGCRCTKRAYLGKEYEPDERIMRNPKTGKNRYVSNISYDQWRSLVGL